MDPGHHTAGTPERCLPPGPPPPPPSPRAARQQAR